MAYNKDIHHRKSIRLRGYDYSQPGAYFITVCTHQRQPLFGDIVDGGMMLNAAGAMVEKCWREIPDHFQWSRLDEFIVMPNHVHGIIIVEPHDTVGAQFIAPHNCAPCLIGQGAMNRGAINQGAINQGAINQGAINQGAINRAPTVGDIIRGFKARCTHGINKVNNTTGQPVWQRNYYEHIIRNEQAYQNIADYICTNPQKWQEDTYYVQTH